MKKIGNCTIFSWTNKRKSHEALSNNFKTPVVLSMIWNDLVHAMNNYVKRPEAKLMLVNKVTDWIAGMLKIFGVEFPEFGFGVSVTSGTAGGSSDVSGEVDMVTKIKVIGPYMDAVAKFRKEMRELILKDKKANPNTDYGELMKLADVMRDETMPSLGIRLEDGTTTSHSWTYVSPSVIIAEIQERKKTEAENKKKNLEKRKITLTSNIDKLKQEVEDEKKMENQDHKTAFDYKYNDAGEPTHDKDGKGLSNKGKSNAVKAIQKYNEKKKKLLAQLAEKGDSYWVEKQNNIAAVERELELTMVDISKLN